MRTDLNIKVKKVPEHYILSADAMDEVASLLGTLAYTQSWDISTDDSERALRMLKLIDGGGEDG